MRCISDSQHILRINICFLEREYFLRSSDLIALMGDWHC